MNTHNVPATRTPATVGAGPATASTIEAGLSNATTFHDALYTVTEARGADDKTLEALVVLRNVGDFVDIASSEIAKGLAFDHPAVVDWCRWAVYKLAEFNGMLPKTAARIELPGTCFTRRKADPIVE